MLCFSVDREAGMLRFMRSRSLRRCDSKLNVLLYETSFGMECFLSERFVRDFEELSGACMQVLRRCEYGNCNNDV